jgi:hypothetical protein
MRTIFFELNEVPWRVIDWFVERHPDSAFAQICGTGQSYETHTEDAGELHPWVTWPSLHRGVSNHDHGIGHLGQDLREANKHFPPLWELLAKQGRNVGVMGAMQSYPLPVDTTDVSFFVPDTYAQSSETIPVSLSLFQDLNLRLTQQNSRNVDRRISANDALTLVASMPKIGVTTITARMIATQLFRETRDKSKLNRRRAIQSALYFDVFMQQLVSESPEYCSFFSNHVAAAMHRFWAASFKEDFAEFDLPSTWVASYADEIDWAMEVADQFLRRMMKYARRVGDCRLVIVSSMGQAATTAQIRDGYYTIGDVPTFLREIGIDPEEARPAQAMAPDVSLHLSDRAATRFRTVAPEIEAAFGDLQIDIDERNMLHMRALVEVDPESRPPLVQIGNRSLSLEELGFVYVADQDKVATTAYHIPNGIMISWSPTAGRRTESRQAPRPISVLEVTPAILAAHNCAAPSYMATPSFSF